MMMINDDWAQNVAVYTGCPENRDEYFGT